jgi:glycosyltransferase involved in cell wall biosynthesis
LGSPALEIKDVMKEWKNAMDSVTASVVTSVYNGEPYFDRALPSILNQTYRDFEYILINDGSEDRTLELLQEARSRDERIRILNPGRLGFARALNLGIRESRGRYIIRQDFDDISYATRIEQQVAFLEANPQVGLVGSYYVLEDQNRNEKYIRKPPTDHESIARAMAKYIPFAHTLVAIRKQALLEVGGIAEVPNITDLRTWIRIGAAGWKFANLPEVLGVHFVYKHSYWHQRFSYRYRQRDLAGVQVEAIRQLGLPKWMLVYPAGRFLYLYLPNLFKRAVRRLLAGSEEEDIS